MREGPFIPGHSEICSADSCWHTSPSTALWITTPWQGQYWALAELKKCFQEHKKHAVYVCDVKYSYKIKRDGKNIAGLNLSRNKEKIKSPERLEEFWYPS